MNGCVLFFFLLLAVGLVRLNPYVGSIITAYFGVVMNDTYWDGFMMIGLDEMR